MTDKQAKPETDPKKLSTDPYKGVRDFYPSDYAVLKYIFSVMRHTVESFGFVEYNASILEPTELYRAKSGEEIVNEQTYSFRDRGDRDVTLRPEMTPTVTRMVAARRRELSLPLRWYSIPNLFRYEKPQRGRLREHYQLNVDIFGISTIYAEVEIIQVASRLMKNFGASEQDFIVRINNRKILNYIFESVLKLSEAETHKATKLLDRKSKISPKDFESEAAAIFGSSVEYFKHISQVESLDALVELIAQKSNLEIAGAAETQTLISTLANLGIKNIIYDISLARGFDYYTGIVFEIFDTDPVNPRALFGGGRYDDLLSVFDSEKVPAVGFGMGDVTIKDFLETHDLLPKNFPAIHLAICTLTPEAILTALKLADTLRATELRVIVDSSERKVSSKIQSADKQKIPYILCIGENEISSKEYNLKNLETGKETRVKSPEEITAAINHI